MKTNNYLLSFMFLIILPLFISCSNNDLTREKASSLIISKYNYPLSEPLNFKKKYLKESYHGNNLVSITSGYTYIDDNMNQIIEKLVASGLIKTNDSKELSNNGIFNLVYINIALTDEGKKYLISEDNDDYILKACDIVFKEVTGIQMKEKSSATANYTLQKENFSPFSTSPSNDITNKVAYFSLFDDGWRIEK